MEKNADARTRGSSFKATRRSGVTAMEQILLTYLITFGWAIVGSVSMGLGIIIAVKMFELSTHRVDEWELIKQNNMAMAIIMAAVILSVALVISSAIQP